MLVNMGMSSGSSSNLASAMSVVQAHVIEQVQIEKDDVSLNNNRRMVLNFGDDQSEQDQQDDNSPSLLPTDPSTGS